MDNSFWIHMECISYYFRVFGAGIYREIFAINWGTQKSVFHNLREYLFKKISRADQASTASPVRLRNVSRQLICLRKSVASGLVLKISDSEIGSYREQQNYSCATNDLVYPRDGIPVVFRLYDKGAGEVGGDGGAYAFAASPAIINGDHCAGPTNSEPIVHCDDGDGCGGKERGLGRLQHSRLPSIYGTLIRETRQM